MKTKKAKLKRKTWNCHDCGVKEGRLHKKGCDMEICITCGGQLISCDCKDKKFGKVPYLLTPNLCGLCGKQWFDMFSTPDEYADDFDELLYRCRAEIKKMFIDVRNGGFIDPHLQEIINLMAQIRDQEIEEIRGWIHKQCLRERGLMGKNHLA